ncbi:hypothetical protein KPH14_012166 [Odynerus spinipes]|uniref:Thioredoxin domain-containing protein n=1 Tax=Odynerus spinipes TaxID=1348599 RepID=A0AAD9RG59_9HYME|nr:hypothetical protein KPH14_012166 [Odynerus spinipes]
MLIIGLSTIILFSIPRASEKPNVNEKRPYDRLFIWRIILVTLLLISSIIGICAYIKFQLLESIRPVISSLIQPNRKPFPMWTRRISLSHKKKKVYEINGSSEFKTKVIDGKGIVVVNFHADWCSSCIQLTSKLMELIEPMETLDLAIINLESNPDLVDILSVKAVPAVLAMSNGLVLDKFVGFQNAQMVEKFVEKLTANNSVHSKIDRNVSQFKDKE